MLTSVGIALIVIGFLLPIIIFFIIRKIRADRRKRIVSEIFDKDGHDRIEIIKDGTDIPISLPFESRDVGFISDISLHGHNNMNNNDLIAIYEDFNRRKVKNILLNEGDLNNAGLPQGMLLEPIPEEEEKF